MVKLGKNMSILSVAFIMIVTLLFIFPATASADMGPKPEIIVKVTNPPEGEYYLDLLTQGANEYKNIEDFSAYDQTKLSLLNEYRVDGWASALVVGTPAPMWGDLIGVKTEEGMEHTFGYMGVPDDFKLIIITPQNQVFVTKEVHREAMKTVLTLDYETINISVEKAAFAYIKQFFETCLATLLIEGILLLVFGFSFRKNWLAFLLINVLTQMVLTFTIGMVFVKEGVIAAFVVFFPVELIIIVIEAVFFAMLLKEHKKSKRILYAITANILSAVVGLLIMLSEYV